MRRKRQLAVVAVATCTIAILPLTIGVLWACGWYAGMTGPRPVEATAGEAQGTVWKADPMAETIQVSPNPLGIGTIAFAVTHETRVVVGDKEGAFGDLYEGTPVRVFYERRDAHLFAVCVQSLSEAAQEAGGEGCRRDPSMREASSAGRP